MISELRCIFLHVVICIIQFGFNYVNASNLNSSFNSDSVTNENYNIVNPPFINEECLRWADSVLDRMSVNEKIGQFFMIDAYSIKDEDHMKEVAGLIKKHKVGGVMFLKGGPARQIKMTNYFQKVAKYPLLIAMDAEWGLSMRLDSTIKYPEQMMLGAIQDNHLIYDMGKDIALQMKRMGVHINFAPVIDVNNNPQNPVISSRSFGENKYNVTYKGLAYMLGMQDNRILATGKHFPGHGDTDTDSHYGLPVINHSFERMDSIELYPFKELIQYGIGGIMVAHLSIPTIDSVKKLPTTLSEKTVTKLLKKKLGFNGIVFSDALNMKAVNNNGNNGKVEAEAFKAGNDILLVPSNIPEAIERIKKGVKKGEISIYDINERCRKILALKKWVGLDKFAPIETYNLYNDLHKRQYYLTLRRLIESSITIVKDKNDFLPLKRLDTLRIASVCLGEGDSNTFQEALTLYAKVDHFTLAKNADSLNFKELRNDINSYNLIILGVHNPSRWASNNFGVNNEVIDFIENLSINKKVVLCMFTNPYAMAKFNNIENIQSTIIAFEDDTLIQHYTAQAIFGGIRTEGKLPVTVGGYYCEGDGVKIDSVIRFKYSMPEEIDIDPDDLTGIDSIVNDAIQSRAIPGCQILCAKDGVVFYHKSFGYHTYLEEKKVKKTDIYDIASITKIASTIPALMHLSDKEQFNIGQKMSYYLPELLETNKKHIFCTDVLTHQARLMPWIPFYISLIQPLYKGDELFSNEFSPDYPCEIAYKMYLNKHFKINNDLYSFFSDSNYSIQVADRFFIKNEYIDTIYNQINISELREKNGYKYSDLGYYYFYRMIERITNRKFNNYLDSILYRPLGATTLRFLPLQHFEKELIVPTENDRIFRQQILHGHVHDPGAAMLGGICGHAGLFSNANDLAKLMQMYLNNGKYGGERYIKKETIDFYTSCPFCNNGNRRGLGFDKPEPNTRKINPVSDLASLESYGHTGFTGTIAWADPKYNMVFIFLSNRIHPDASNSKLIKMNIRSNIQEEFYKAILNNNIYQIIIVYNRQILKYL
ncbi:glycoside hydrolase family 3 N-terminal domain-containing protein [Bacteroidota bacterium]